MCERKRLHVAICLTAAALLASPIHSQAPLEASATPAPFSRSLISSSNDSMVPEAPGEMLAETPASGAAAAGGISVARPMQPRMRVSVTAHVGLEGIGFDTSAPIAPRLQLRGTANFGSYSTSFTDQGANVNAKLVMQSQRLSADWFVFGGRFHLSPSMTVSNHNAFRGTVLVPGGQAIDMSNSTYVSSSTDPLRGAAEVSFRRLAPGFSIGWSGNGPEPFAGKAKHWSFPTELGFYYVGQPKLNVMFTGTACDPSQPATIGCQKVTSDAGFQKSLAAFVSRNNHNLSYASFMPIASAGVAFRF